MKYLKNFEEIENKVFWKVSTDKKTFKRLLELLGIPNINSYLISEEIFKNDYIYICK